MNSDPLAPDMAMIIDGKEGLFQTGLYILARGLPTEKYFCVQRGVVIAGVELGCER